MQNIKKKKFLSDFKIWEIVGTGRAEYDVGVLSEKSDEVYCDLEVAIE